MGLDPEVTKVLKGENLTKSVGLRISVKRGKTRNLGKPNMVLMHF